jgi:hypothetical protein
MTGLYADNSRQFFDNTCIENLINPFIKAVMLPAFPIGTTSATDERLKSKILCNFIGI